jgi:hypothetical protein
MPDDDATVHLEADGAPWPAVLRCDSAVPPDALFRAAAKKRLQSGPSSGSSPSTPPPPPPMKGS